MTDALIPIKAIAPIFFTNGTATATGRLRDGVPEITNGVREIPVRGIVSVPPAEARRLIDKRRAVLFEPGGKFKQLLPVVDVLSPAEAAEAGAGIKDILVWHARNDAAGHWRPAPGQTGLGPLTDSAFSNVKAVRVHWVKYPKSVPLFVLHESEGVRAFAWINGALVEALRN